MLRRDGTFTIYRIEHDTRRDGNHWSGAGDAIFAEVPIEIRYASDEDRRNGRLAEPFRAFSAGGECWQKTGVHGTFDREQAIEMMLILARHVPGRLFRVVRVDIEQKTTQEAHCAINAPAD